MAYPTAMMLLLACALVTGAPCGCDGSQDQPLENPDDPAAMRTAIGAVETSLRNARIDEARRIATRLAEVAPESGDAFELLGRVEIACGLAATDPAQQMASRIAAAKAYARAVELSPPSAGLHNAAGVAAQSAGDLTAAIVLFERAAKLDPANPQHQLFAGLALLSAGRVDEARVGLSSARALDPKSPWPVSALSGLALSTGDFQGALDLAREARRLDPRVDELRVPEAKALRKLARHQEVLTLLLALPEQARLTEAIAWEISAAQFSMGDKVASAKTWGRWSEVCGSAQSAVESAQKWDEAGDPIQAHSWRQVARQRGWSGSAHSSSEPTKK